MWKDCWFVPWLSWGLTSAGMEDGWFEHCHPPISERRCKTHWQTRRESISLHHSPDSLCLQWWPVLNFLLMCVCVCVCLLREDACIFQSLWMLGVFFADSHVLMYEKLYVSTVCIYVLDILYNPVSDNLILLMICEWDHGTTYKNSSHESSNISLSPLRATHSTQNALREMLVNMSNKQ